MEQYKGEAENTIEADFAEKIEKLSEMLAGDLDKKVTLHYHAFSKTYGLALVEGTGESMIVDGDKIDDQEKSALLTELYNQYKQDFTLDTAFDIKYKPAENDKDTNSTTPETLGKASFILKDFLEDMKKHIESK